MEIYRKKRRAAHGPSKNELRASRGEREERQKAQTGTLRQRYPQTRKLELSLRFESAVGATLEQIRREVGLDEPLLLNLDCPGGCGGGVFLLTEAVEALLQANSEIREGMALCQAASYSDPRNPCSTKLYYKISIGYDGIEEPSKNK